MAELHNLGNHCSVSTCKQLDFLPFVCDGCSKVFCLEHRSTDSHNCSQCNVTMKDSHSGDGQSSYECSLDGCKDRVLMPVTCESCQKNFCLRHRYQSEHKCTSFAISDQKSESSQEKFQTSVKEMPKVSIDKTKGRGSKKAIGAKNVKMAARVALMKMKSTAQGDKSIPDSERVHLQVFLPEKSQERMRQMFFSKQWSVGHCIDNIAKSASLPNNNNLAAAKKLRLFSGESGQILATDLKLEFLLLSEEALVLNGGNVILEYVENTIMCLEDPGMYLKYR